MVEYLKRGALFLAVVWSISGAYLVLLNGQTELVNRAIRVGLIPPDLVISREGKEHAAQRCAASGAVPAHVGSVTDAADLRTARIVAYEMGMKFGLAESNSFLADRREAVINIMQDVRRFASGLSVPAPELPSTFSGTDLESDPQCTASRLASRYTPAHGQIYKFGVAVGRQVFACANEMCGENAGQIRLYGELAGVPKHIWSPLAQDSLDGIPGANAPEKAIHIRENIKRYIVDEP